MNNKNNLKLSDINSILFVCKGNICRSPFAQYYAQKIFPGSINIESSGYYSEIGRKCPNKAIKAAKEYGIKLQNHRSTFISKDKIEEAKIIYVFDQENYEMLNKLYPDVRSKISFLGNANNSFSTIISDPYGKKYDQYKKTYQLISQSLDYINNIF